MTVPGPLGMLLVAIGLQAASGLAGLAVPGRSRAGAVLSAAMMLAGAVAGCLAVVLALRSPDAPELGLPWTLPIGRLALELDGLSAAFLLPAMVVPALGSLYGVSYWSRAEHPGTAPKLGVFYGLLAAALAVVIVARDAVLFLVGWEVMALSAFFLITTDDDDEAVRGAGWIYLVATHLGTLVLMALFAMLYRATGSFALDPLPPGALGAGGLTAIFALAVAGFGLKAGIMPLHVWLPGAHAMAPSHVSAVLSGVMIKAGVYGIVRFCGLLPDPPAAWGAALLVLGGGSAVAGIVSAIAQQDLKRRLAYSSVENVGIIMMGVGLALLGRSAGRTDLVALGLTAALLHVWNHALFKSLLFLCAGSVIHATGTRRIDQLGGLARAMPRTFGGFAAGSAAVCGLPPLGGFVSELLLLVGLVGTIGPGAGASWVGAALGAPVVAMVAALSLGCFAGALGAVFLGHPRSEAAAHAHESSPLMTLPIGVLAACCLALGLAPGPAVTALQPAIETWAAPDQVLPTAGTLVPLGTIGALDAALLVTFAAGVLLLRCRMRPDAVTWDCGYAAPTPRMQYTASSLGQMPVHFFAWLVRPRTRRPRLDTVFPGAGAFESRVDDAALHGAVLPAFRRSERWLLRVRFLQQGRVQAYIVYILVFLVLLLLWVVPAGALAGPSPRSATAENRVGPP